MFAQNTAPKKLSSNQPVRFLKAEALRHKISLTWRQKWHKQHCSTQVPFVVFSPLMSSLITITGSGRADQLAKVCCELRSPLTLTTNVDPYFQVYVPPNPSPTPPFRRNCAHLVRGHGIRARGRRHGRHGHQRAHSHVDPQFLARNHRPSSNFRIFSSISEPFFPSFRFFSESPV